jgi:hypothetical protein
VSARGSVHWGCTVCSYCIATLRDYTKCRGLLANARFSPLSCIPKRLLVGADVHNYESRPLSVRRAAEQHKGISITDKNHEDQDVLAQTSPSGAPRLEVSIELCNYGGLNDTFFTDVQGVVYNAVFYKWFSSQTLNDSVCQSDPTLCGLDFGL